MSEKKAKETRRKDIYTKVVITVHFNGDVDVEGPIGNFIFFTEIMTKAMQSVIEHTGNEMKKMIEQAMPPVKVPNFIEKGEANE